MVCIFIPIFTYAPIHLPGFNLRSTEARNMKFDIQNAHNRTIFYTKIQAEPLNLRTYNCLRRSNYESIFKSVEFSYYGGWIA